MKSLEKENGCAPREAILTLSVKAASIALGISTKSIHRLIKRNKLKTLQSFRHKLIPRSEIHRFINEDAR